MKLKNTFLTLLILSTFVAYSAGQNERAIHLGLAEGLSYKFKGDQLFLASELQLGIQFAMNKGSVRTFGAYQLFGNMSDKNFKSYTYASQLLGLGAEYQSNSDKKVSLIGGVTIMTEIYSNFKNGYMVDGSLVSPQTVRPYADDYSAFDSQKEYNYYSSSHYQSTPLNVSIWLGLNVKLSKSLNASFSILNDNRLISEKYFKWDLTDKEEEQLNLIGKDINELIDSQPISRSVINRFGLRFGLSYTLPFSKTK